MNETDEQLKVFRDGVKFFTKDLSYALEFGLIFTVEQDALIFRFGDEFFKDDLLILPERASFVLELLGTGYVQVKIRIGCLCKAADMQTGKLMRCLVHRRPWIHPPHIVKTA